MQEVKCFKSGKHSEECLYLCYEINKLCYKYQYWFTYSILNVSKNTFKEIIHQKWIKQIHSVVIFAFYVLIGFIRSN